MLSDLVVDTKRPSRAHLFFKEIIQGLRTSTYIEDIWRPQESLIGPPHPQQELIKATCDEMFFGGARGGGKSDGVLGKWLYHHRDHGGRARGVIVRRVFKNLEDLISRSHELFPQTQGKFVGGTAPKWVWPDGAELRIRHLKNEQDARSFQGHGYTFVGVEEAQQYPQFEPIRMLFAAMRSASGVKPQMILTGNPGDVGMGWIKLRYIDPHPEGFIEVEDQELGLTRMFIPSKLEDNPALFHGDPTYERRILASTSNLSLQKGWRYGIWDIPSGGYWETVWDPEGRQVLKWFPIPDGWTVFTSFDWGFSKPSALGVWGVSNGEPLPDDHPVYPGRVFPSNSMILFHEDYTVRHEQSGTPIPNEGLRITNQALGKRIEEFLINCLGDRYPVPGLADPTIFDDKGGDSIFTQMQEDTDYYWDWHRALNARVEGWAAVRNLLSESAKTNPEGPGLWVTDNCTEWRRTFPGLPIDQKNPDDLDTDAEDHDADQTRYAVMTWTSQPDELYVEEIY